VATLFLAYAVADRERALALATGLRSADHTVHTDPHPAGDAGWWAAVLSTIQEADALLYATPPAASTSAGPALAAPTSAGSTSSGAAGAGGLTSRWAPPGATAAGGSGTGVRFTGESAASIVVAREREYAEALGIPTLEIHLSGAGPATGVDFREPDADAAFRLIGAIASLPARPPMMGWQPAPESPFAGVADLVRDVQAPVLAPADQRTLADRLRTAAAADPAARELAAILRRRTDLDAEAARRLDDAFAPGAAAEGRIDEGDRTFPATGGADPQSPVATGVSTQPGSRAPRAAGEQVASSKWAPPGSLTADDVRHIRFRKAPLGRRGYDEESVDKFLDQIESDLRSRHGGGRVIRVVLTAADVEAVAFLRPPFGRRGYDEEEVDSFLDEIQRNFTALDRDLTARGAEVAKA
jgi:DivIVA domain-containing protein